ncbi:MAG: flavin reductase family protein [Pararhodobacter sp.]
MFYQPQTEPHGLPFDPFKACVVPRPIAWVSTVSRDGIRNLAPFSFYNAFSWAPPVIGLGMPGRGSRTRGKDTLENIEETGELVVNMATEAMAEAINLTSARFAPDVDEFDAAGVIGEKSRLVAPDRVAAAPVHFECRHLQTVALPGPKPDRSNALVLATVVGVHIRDEVIREGRLDLAAIRPLARLGYRDWAGLGTVFTQEPPD